MSKQIDETAANKAGAILHESKHLKKTYFENAKRKPTVGTFVDRNPNGAFANKWFFEQPAFKYDAIVLPISTLELQKHILIARNKISDEQLGHEALTCREKVIDYPVSAKHSGEYLKYYVTHSNDWPTWIPLKRNQNYVLSYNGGKGTHAVWNCHCKQPGCHTAIQITVEINPLCVTSYIKVVFYDDRCTGHNVMMPAQCVHWEHWREGGMTDFDLKDWDFKNKKAEAVWETDIELMKGTEQQLFCNTDGHFRNMQMVNNLLSKYNEQMVTTEVDVFDKVAGQPQKWMAEITQQGYDHKMKQLNKDKRGLEWNDAGWFHILDLLNIKISIYHQMTCDPIAFYPQLLTEGIFIDDMSHLVGKLWGRKLCHSIAFVRHPAGRLPLMIFEFITGDWRQPTFEALFSEWWLFVSRRHVVRVPSFCTDWDRKLQNAICNTVNQMTLKKYLELTFKVPSGQFSINSFQTLLFSCHGHAAGAISRHCNKKPNTKLLAGSFWRKIRLVRNYVQWQRAVSFFKWFVENKFIKYTNAKPIIPLINPLKRNSWCPGSENSSTEKAICKFILNWCNEADIITDTEAAYEFIGWSFQKPASKKRKLNIDNEPSKHTLNTNSNSNNKSM